MEWRKEENLEMWYAEQKYNCFNMHIHAYTYMWFTAVTLIDKYIVSVMAVQHYPVCGL